MATIPPPPPPPPAPVIQQPAKILARRERPPADRNNVGGLRPTGNTQQRSPLANIHPEALQHQLANLRKTQYREPLLASESEQLLGRPSEFPPGGYRESFQEHEGLGKDYARKEIPPSTIGPNEHLPFNYGSQYSHSLNQAFNNPPKTNFTDPRTSKWMPGPQAQQMYSTNYSNNSKKPGYYSSSSTTYYPGTDSYSYSYSSTTTTDNGFAQEEPPNYPPPPPPDNGSFVSNYFSTSTVTNGKGPASQNNG